MSSVQPFVDAVGRRRSAATLGRSANGALRSLASCLRSCTDPRPRITASVSSARFDLSSTRPRIPLGTLPVRPLRL